MGIGPFESFAFPGVYTKTLNEAPRVTSAGALRFAAFVGVADETIPQNNVEMIRGSSSLADNPIVKEDVSSQVTGANREFTVTYFPVVSGNGTGTTTNTPTDVLAYVNDEPVPVSSVAGATGVINLISIPAMDDTVKISYYFKRTDTLITNEDLSIQADGVNTVLKTQYVPIVQGDNGGITTTDPTKVTVRVNSIAVTVSAVDGESGQITLASAPGAQVQVTYYTNTLQNTSDIIPGSNVSAVTKLGYSPGSSDFINGTDFVVDTSGAFATINWGNSYKVASGQHTIGYSYFDSSKITVSMYDNRTFRRLATGTSDGTNKEFTLEAVPTTGQGLGITTDQTSLVIAYVGTTPMDASRVAVAELSGTNRVITLQTAPDASRYVFVTQYTNLMTDDTWTLTDTTTGAVGVGAYTINGASSGAALYVSDTTAVVADPDFGTEGVTYPDGAGEAFRDVQVLPGYGIEETVWLTFSDATTYTVSSTATYGSGSAGDNTGYLNQTYIDRKTGFRVTILQGTVEYVLGDKIGYHIRPTVLTSTTYRTRAIPGVKINVSNTSGIAVGDTGLVTTYNKSGNEPGIGDFYYISFDQGKDFDSNGLTKAALYTLEKDVISAYGPISINNKLVLAAHLSFLNGAPAVALLQIQKTSGGLDAPDSRYISGIDYFNDPMVTGDRPSLMEPVTTSTAVLSYLKTSNQIQSGIRYANERMSYFGFPVGTTPSTAQVYARSTNSERMIGVYPDGAITTITDELGNNVEYLVDGSFLAAAICGRDTSPAFDVATPLTNKPVVGFNRLYRRLDSVTAAQTANAGLTFLEEQGANINIRIDLTTDVSSVLTRTPSVIRIKDFVQKGARANLKAYIGQKFLMQKTKEIEQTLSSYLASLRQSEIIKAYQGVKATVDPNDATIVNVEAFYSPVLPLLWIVITFNLRSSM